MKGMKKSIVLGFILLSSVIGFVGSLLIATLEPSDFIMNIAGIFAIITFAMMFVSFVSIFREIDEGPIDINRDVIKKD